VILQNFSKLATFGPKLMAPALQELSNYSASDSWLPTLWSRHVERQSVAGSPHHSTETIYLRGPVEFTLKDYFSIDTIDFDFEQQCLPELTKLAGKVFDLLEAKGLLGRILITKLKPHSEIDEHHDEGPYSDHFQRVHLSLVSSAQDYLACGNESVSMKPGELWWFNHKVTHMAENWGAEPRIHMILDYRT